MANFNTRTLTGNIGQSSFNTDDDEIQFVVQGVNVMNLRTDAIDMPILTTDGLVRSDEGVLSTDTTIGPSIDALALRVTTNENDIATLETQTMTNTSNIATLNTQVTANVAELADHETRIEELENEPAFNIEPITLDKINDRVGINIVPDRSLHVNGTARVSGNMDVLSNFAIGIASTTGPVRLNVNGLSSFRGASFLGGVSITGGNLSVVDDIIANGAVRTPEVFTNILRPPEVLTVDGDLHVGTNCYIGNYSTGTFACFKNTATTSLSNDYALLQDTSGRTILNCSTGQTLEFRQNNSARMSITSSGNIDINGNLNVDGQITGAVDLMRFPGDASGAINRTQITAGTNTDRFIRFRSGGGSPNGISGVQFSHFDNPNFYIFTTGLGLEIYQNTTNSSTKGQFGDRLITLSPGGNLGINVSSPTQRLHVDGNAIITGSLSASEGFKNQFDNRALAPNDINATEFRFGFGSYYNNNASPWADVLHLNSFNNSTGGGTNAVMFKKTNGPGIRQYQGTYNSANNYSTNYADAMMCTYDEPRSKLLTGTQSLPGNNAVAQYGFNHGIGSKWENVTSLSGMYRYASSGPWRPMTYFTGVTPVALYANLEFINSTQVVVRITNGGSSETLHYKITLNYQDN